MADENGICILTFRWVQAIKMTTLSTNYQCFENQSGVKSTLNTIDDTTTSSSSTSTRNMHQNLKKNPQCRELVYKRRARRQRIDMIRKEIHRLTEER
jgi:hypothetical protein